jgi:hypothetical protein
MKRVVLVSIAVLLLAGSLVFALKIKRWLEIDACLDSGGSWNYETNKCEYGDGKSDSRGARN